MQYLYKETVWILLDSWAFFVIWYFVILIFTICKGKPNLLAQRHKNSRMLISKLYSHFSFCLLCVSVVFFFYMLSTEVSLLCRKFTSSYSHSYCTHTLEEFKLVKISSNIPRETRFTNRLRVSFFLVCFDDRPLQKVLKGSSLD